MEAWKSLGEQAGARGHLRRWGWSSVGEGELRVIVTLTGEFLQTPSLLSLANNPGRIQTGAESTNFITARENA